MIDLSCRTYTTAPASRVLDIDYADNRVHGGQQVALFNTPRRQVLLSADSHPRGQQEKASPVVHPARQAAVRRGDRARLASRHSPHPPPLAAGRHSVCVATAIIALEVLDVMHRAVTTSSACSQSGPWWPKPPVGPGSAVGAGSSGLPACAGSMSLTTQPARGACKSKVAARVEATARASDVKRRRIISVRRKMNDSHACLSP
jgi:hypothetical protein